MKPKDASRTKFQWEMNVPLLTNRFVLYDLAKLVAVVGMIMFLLFAGLSLILEPRAFLRNLWIWVKISSAMALGLLALLSLVMLLFFWNRFPMRFTLSPEGARVESLSQRGKWANRLALILGLLSGKPHVAFAGYVGMGQEVVRLRWSEVHRAVVHPGSRVITLCNSWRPVFRLFCPAENFPAIAAAVQAWVEQGRRIRERAVKLAGKKAAPSLWRRQVGLTGLTLLFGLLLLPLPPEGFGLVKLALALATLAGIWVPGLKRLAGLTSLALALGLAVLALNYALQPRQMFQEAEIRRMLESQGQKPEKIPDWMLGRYRRYEIFHPADWAAFGAGTLGVLYFGAFGILTLAHPWQKPPPP